MADDVARRFNYAVFSARTGNIYTPTLLKQWLDWSEDHTLIPDEIWTDPVSKRVYDPFRPTIEPEGFMSAAELKNSRHQSINSFLNSVEQADVFVFTLGLTERWVNRIHNYEYPICPGTAAGEFQPDLHQFENLNVFSATDALVKAIETVNTINPKVRVILTVSPVPLVATATDEHVVVATMYSKSVLRAAAQEVVNRSENVHYFPSYEIFNSPAFEGVFFEPNKRSVSLHGVEYAMNEFFRPFPEFTRKKSESSNKSDDRDAEICDEVLLEAFSESS